MKETLLDIQSKLRDQVYTNEEHIRLSLVARILQKLGWNIWEPREVNTEFATLPDENRKKIDIALFLEPSRPSVFIEVKALGRIDNSLREIERQLRDYNSNITSPFSIITDGSIWKFYYSQTGGEFHDKCFRTVDLLKQTIDESKATIDDVEHTLQLFLSRASMASASGEAKREAEKLLDLTLVEKAMERCLPEARRLIEQNPLVTLADALVQFVEKEGYSVSRENAAQFIRKIAVKKPKGEDEVVLPPTRNDVIKLDPHSPGDLRFTRNVEGQVGETNCGNWKEFLHAAVEKAWRKEPSLSHLRNCGVSVVEGKKTDEGYNPLSGLGISVRGVSANDAWKISLNIAEKLLNLPIRVQFSWADRPQAAYPGREGILSWSPQQT